MIEEIIGKSQAIKKIRDRAKELSGNRKNVLIVGPEGVGKGLVGKTIHEDSRYAKKPLIELHLNVMDYDEVSDFLDGLEHGKVRRNNCEIVATDGATLLLCDAADLSFTHQKRFVTLISEYGDKRKGGARFIVTMREDADDLFEKRKLQEDFYNVVKTFEYLSIPPLKERKEDVPYLVHHFAQQIAKRVGVGELVIDVNALDILVRQSWNRNVKELKAVIDRSVLLSDGRTFNLPPELLDEHGEIAKIMKHIAEGKELLVDHSLDFIQKRIIERVLERFEFNQKRTAEFLGISEDTLRYRMRRLGIAIASERSQ
ncbi:MAG: sigma-54-dependent Fis family transcriptional regulator [Ignavibacteriae bacterium]|nr:sigma-54-dependent Fis family transcriptional regulator [Ignavibacteriota bacterium]